jgi:hypothetical protein
MDSKKSDEYSEQEAQRRFTAALRGAFGTKPTALKDVPRKRPKAKRKRQTKTSA